MSPASRSHDRRDTAFLLTAAVLLAAVALAQGRVDFSGQWQLVEPTDVEEHVARQLEARHSTSGLEVLTVERVSPGGVQSASYHIGLVGGLVGGIVGFSRAQETRTEFSNTWRGV